MISASIDKQLMVTVDNKVGTLSEITGTIASAAINLIAACAYAIDNKGFLAFVTEDNARSVRLLEEKGFNVREEEVVLVSLGNKPGTLQALSEKIADAGIDLNMMYGSVDQGGKTSRIVLVAEDAPGVLSLIRLMK